MTAASQFGTIVGDGFVRGVGAFLDHLLRIPVPALDTVDYLYDYPLWLEWILLFVMLVASIPGWIMAKLRQLVIMLAAVRWVLQ